MVQQCFYCRKTAKDYLKLFFRLINCHRIIYIIQHHKILNLLNEANDSKFVSRKWNIVIANSKANHAVGDSIIYNKEVLKSDLCDYNDFYILVLGDITITEDNGHGVEFKNFAAVTKCLTEIDGRTIDDAEDLDLVRPMFNFVENSSNYSEIKGSLWFYSKDEATNFSADIGNDDIFKSFKYKAKLLGHTAENGADGILRKATIAVPLKYLSNFGRSLETPLTDCKVELELERTKYCVFSATFLISKRQAKIIKIS